MRAAAQPPNVTTKYHLNKSLSHELMHEASNPGSGVGRVWPFGKRNPGREAITTSNEMLSSIP